MCIIVLMGAFVLQYIQHLLYLQIMKIIKEKNEIPKIINYLRVKKKQTKTLK